LEIEKDSAKEQNAVPLEVDALAKNDETISKDAEVIENKIVEHENIYRLKMGDKNIALIGTAHVSQESADLVQKVIETEKPDTVCIELCESRYQSMKNRDSWKNMDLIKVLKEGKAIILVINFMLSSFQRKIAKKFGVTPGQEMIQAIASTEEIGSTMEVIDRDVRTTLSRTWGFMGFKSRMNLFIEMVGLSTLLLTFFVFAALIAKTFFPLLITKKVLLISIGLIFGAMFLFSSKENETDELTKDKLEDMKKQDTLELLLAEMGESVPDIKLRLIDERDLYMVEMLRRSQGTNIVAIVGAGHAPGMMRNWETDIDLEDLKQAPPSKNLGTIFKWGIPALIIGLFVLGYFIGGKEMLTDSLWTWVLFNGVLSAIGTAIALGHPLSILTAFIAAPITSLNPTIGAGMVVGYVEAKLRKPKVDDFERLPEDFTTPRGWWRNKVTRVLLVFMLSSLGSGIGTWAAGFKIAADLDKAKSTKVIEQPADTTQTKTEKQTEPVPAK